jgi:hypothetical protein
MSDFGDEATQAVVRNPQYTMAVYMVGIAQRVIPIADFGKTLAGQFRQGTDGLWHITLPVRGRFARLPLPGSCGAKQLRLVRGTWSIDSASFALLCNQKKAEARRSQQAKCVNTPFRPLTGTIEIGRSDRH